MNNIYLNFAKKIAYQAGEIMLKYFNKDNEINDYLIKQVKKQFPEHSVDGEEEQFGKRDYVWVCDPVDGTAMYARHIPVAVFSLALVIDGESIVGLVYDPFTDNLYTAIKGQGAYKNNQRIEVNDILLNDMKSVSNFDMWSNADYNLYDVIKEIGKETYFVSVGSVIRACMCVASGEFNFAIFPGTKHKNCDIAAAKVIVEEAGGKVTNLFGNDQRYDESIKGAVVSNGKIHNEVVDSIKKYVSEV